VSAALVGFIVVLPEAVIGLAAVAVVAGIGAVAIDAGPCRRGNQMACAGAYIGGASVGFGIAGLGATVAMGAEGVAVGYNLQATLFGAGSMLVDAIAYEGEYGHEVSELCE
jgi:hypothetical protein